MKHQLLTVRRAREMANVSCFLRALLLSVLLSSSVVCVTLAKPASKAPTPVARKEDVKYIKCGVCNEIAKQLSILIEKNRASVAPKQLSEYQIIELAENICNLKKHEGDWILHQDIVEDGDKLLLVEQKDEGECGTECKTIQMACNEVMDYSDTDLAEFIFKGVKDTDSISKFLCKDLSKACVGKIPPVPKDRKPGEPFSPKSSKDAELERIMRSMSDMPGAPGMKVYSKDDLMSGMPNFSGDDDDEDEDEDDDSYTPSKKSTPKKAIGQVKSFIDSITSRTKQLVRNGWKHMERVSHQVWKWWSGNAASGKNSKSSSSEL